MNNKSIGKNLYIQKYRFNYKKAIRTINQLIWIMILNNIREDYIKKTYKNIEAEP
jgi:hypothetical protein